MTMAGDTFRLPEMIPIPAGAASMMCECGVRFWWVRHKGKSVPISCPATLETKTMGVLSLPVKVPTGITGGVGIYHHIDCANRKKFGSGPMGVERAATSALGARPVTESDEVITDRIRTAEALAETHGVRCTGAPNMTEPCNGFAVICFVLANMLFAAPCSAHADAVQRALKLDRRSDHKAHALHEYLSDRGGDVAARFATRCHAIRDDNATNGFRVPPRAALT